MDRLVRRWASSVLGCPLDSVEVVGNGRMMAKLSSLLNNTSHPLQDTLTALGSSFSERLLHPRCVKERGRMKVLKFLLKQARITGRQKNLRLFDFLQLRAEERQRSSPPWWTEGFTGEARGLSVLQGGERGTNDLLSFSHDELEGLPAGRGAGAVPHGDAAGQDTLDGASVEGAHDGGRGSSFPQFVEEVEALLAFLASDVVLMVLWRGPL
ncbi:hypothetical protein L3Q82_000031 [Scortum barcoo]|uniref:Uncharacterized protein n=1 Tax=Scortum barcoo TaxID=214431 RepID=A0ACB8XA95_9TELE|nr:hypothetical protein L3Q82_000031 [Scortum barcoo]